MADLAAIIENEKRGLSKNLNAKEGADDDQYAGEMGKIVELSTARKRQK